MLADWKLLKCATGFGFDLPCEQLGVPHRDWTTVLSAGAVEAATSSVQPAKKKFARTFGLGGLGDALGGLGDAIGDGSKQLLKGVGDVTEATHGRGATVFFRCLGVLRRRAPLT